MNTAKSSKVFPQQIVSPEKRVYLLKATREDEAMYEGYNSDGLRHIISYSTAKRKGYIDGSGSFKVYKPVLGIDNPCFSVEKKLCDKINIQNQKKRDIKNQGARAVFGGRIKGLKMALDIIRGKMR